MDSLTYPTRRGSKHGRTRSSIVDLRSLLQAGAYTTRDDSTGELHKYRFIPFTHTTPNAGHSQGQPMGYAYRDVVADSKALGKEVYQAARQLSATTSMRVEAITETKDFRPVMHPSYGTTTKSTSTLRCIGRKSVSKCKANLAVHNISYNQHPEPVGWIRPSIAARSLAPKVKTTSCVTWMQLCSPRIGRLGS